MTSGRGATKISSDAAGCGWNASARASGTTDDLEGSGDSYYKAEALGGYRHRQASACARAGCSTSVPEKNKSLLELLPRANQTVTAWWHHDRRTLLQFSDFHKHSSTRQGILGPEKKNTKHDKFCRRRRSPSSCHHITNVGMVVPQWSDVSIYYSADRQLGGILGARFAQPALLERKGRL